MIVEIEDKDYEEIIKKDKKVVIDCYASWCGPCKMLSPIIDELAKELDNYKFYKLNVDNSELVTSKYEIMSIPTILIFEDGKLIDKVVGLRSKSELKELFK
ncbi:MAG: thioredoxin [Bacilli bacterium]|nr:thioredoxin [Bacilli bacterium]